MDSIKFSEQFPQCADTATPDALRHTQCQQQYVQKQVYLEYTGALETRVPQK